MAAVAPPVVVPPALPPVFVNTVRQCLAQCGVDDQDLFDNETDAERLAGQIFNNDFDECMSIVNKDLEAAFQTFSDLTVANGRIRLTYGVERFIRSFIGWVRHTYSSVSRHALQSSDGWFISATWQVP